jgi:hypothetical protein
MTRTARLLAAFAIAALGACGGGSMAPPAATPPDAASRTAAPARALPAPPVVDGRARPSIPVVPAGRPVVLYTDLLSGPNRGGENGKGAYLSIFGRNFGATGLGTRVKVHIGGVEVDNYRTLGPSRGRPDIEQITVQVGALGDPVPGTPLPIRVTVAGVASNTDRSFTVNPGRILFVDNVAGNDANAVPDDITRPYRRVQTADLRRGGAWPEVRPGDLIVMRGRGAAQPWTDVGFQGYFLRVRDKSGSAPTGAPGTGPIALVGYPGEDAFIRGTLAGGMTRGCVSAVNGQSFPGMGQWVVVANLRIDCEGYDGPISQQIHGHFWRVVNNDLSASSAPRSGPAIPRMAGITGNGRGSVWYGNRIHDIQGSSGECHGVYIDGDGSYDIGFNFIHDIRDGNGFQVYANGRNGTDFADDIALHHNLIRNVSKHGINIADGARDQIRVWNNVVTGTQLAGVRFNTNILRSARIWHNTFHDVNLARHRLYGALVNDWALPPGSIDVRHNVFQVTSGSPYVSGSVGFSPAAGTIARNLWSGSEPRGTTPSAAAATFDRSPVLADPGFTAPGSDFRPRAGSPALGAGVEAAEIRALVTTDYAMVPRDGPLDLGALRR